MLDIRLCESKRGQSENGSRMIECSNATMGLTLQFVGKLSVLLLVVIVCSSGVL
jgi:hypothetical protein